MAGQTNSVADVRAMLGRLPRRARLLVVGSAVICVAIIAAWGMGAFTADDYSPLFSSLEPADAADVIANLEAEGIPYRLGGSGTTVLVPASQVHRTRLVMASQGLPRGGVVGYELLDRTKLGSTEFERRLSYHRALEGELTRTISQIGGVVSARVHLVNPEPSLFVADRKQPTAAVMLGLRPGSELEADQVRGIKHLVSRSVEGLEVDDVTVLDSSGRVLSASSSSGPSGTTLAQMDTQSRLQADLKDRLEALLGQVFGPGNAIAQVTADMNFDEKVIEKSLLIPAENRDGLVRSLREVEEHFSGEGVPPGGVPGTASNVADTPVYQAVTGTGSSEYERREVTKETEFNRTYEHLVIAPGTVQRLSVSAVINRTFTPEEATMVEAMIRAAIGYDEQRRDHIVVTGMEFDTTLADELRQAMQADVEARSAAGRRNAIMIGGALAAALILVVMVMRGIANRRRELAELAATERTGSPEPKPNINDEETMSAQRHVERLVRQRPETVAHLIRAWLAEE